MGHNLQLKLQRVKDILLEQEKLRLNSGSNKVSEFIYHTGPKYLQNWDEVEWLTFCIYQPLSFGCINRTQFLSVIYMCFHYV